ncbi:transcription factor Ouib [Drosophila eugracilis]|uniref:transcription factor Ouib n=1 Tax=Drosophila eugracilis TaxID=29029 RepID=UPI001BDA6AD8|nr:transcription factor Ouib [Drosophila eugracilis]
MLINVCRVCGRSRLCPKAVNLFKPGRKELLRRIHLITGIRLQQIPNAPDMVCFCCQTDITSAMLFRTQFILEQKKWVPVKNIDEVVENKVQKGKEKVEKEEEKKKKEDPVPKKRKCQRRKSQSWKPLETVDIVVKSDIKTSTGVDDEFDQPVEIFDKPEASDSDVNLENIEIKDSELFEVEKDLDSNCELPKVQIYKCDTCGLIKYNKSTLERHMYEHTGIRPHPCKECKKTFLTANELRAHYLSHHTMEPPFDCRYCERRYFSAVGRKKHERIHTNERPFVCDQCGKAFTRSCTLNAHKETHTANKKFSCDVCDRSFSLKKHLVTHFRSNAHKRKTEMALSLSESMSLVNIETNETWSQSQGTQVVSPINDNLVQTQFVLLCEDF